ncbi:hypothetical protein MKX03_023996, partial [Papaver bracteatum]
LPRLFCSHCHRLGHEFMECIEIYLLNFQNLLLQASPEIPPQPALQALGHFIEPGYDDDYHEEMLNNIVIEDPNQDWSDWGSSPAASTAVSDQDNSTISFFDGEGYQLEGFHSDTSPDQSTYNSEAGIVEENNNFEDSST